MDRYKALKSYDIKSFLDDSKKKGKASGKSFVLFTVGRRSINILVLFFVFVGVLLAACMLIDVSYVSEKVYASAVPLVFPSAETASRKDSTVLLSGIASVVIGFKPSELSVSDMPPLPDGRIKTMNDTSKSIDIKNETDYTIDVSEYLKHTPTVSVSKPKVLIVHTHGSESYTPSEKFMYKSSGNYRTQDTKCNMIRVGECIAKEIRKYGIEVIHDTSINDYPSYNASYSKTASVIEDYLKKDKEIVFVFDIHRDAVGDDKNIVRLIADVNGKQTAQIMTVCGTDVNLSNPRWTENLRLGIYIQDKIEKKYPGLMRPLNLRKERFNMHLTEGSLLFEIGTNGNTLDEALGAAEIFGKELGEIICSLTSK